MDLFNEAWNLDETLEEDADNELKDEASRDACIFLLDRSLQHVDLVCAACSSRAQDRLISNPKDMIGLILFDGKEATVVLELQTPSVDVISQIEALPLTLRTQKAGESEENCGLNEALWICSRVFSRCNQKMYSKRVMLFTDVDDPYPRAKKQACSTDKLLRRQVLQRSKDLYDAGVRIDVIPSGKGPFSYSRFYQHVMFKADEEITDFEAEVSVDSMLRRIRRKDYPLRAAVAGGRLRLPINSEHIVVAPSFSLYRLVQATGCPAKVRIDRRTDKEVANSRRWVVRNEGMATPLLPSDVRYEVSVAGREARFSAEELLSDGGGLKETDLLLVGFKPMECLKAIYYLKPGYVLSANDKKCYNSSKVFNALYHQCLDRRSFILCKLAMSRGSCHLVALVPDEELETFYVAMLPFADDIRPSQADRTATGESSDAKISEPAVDAMSSIVRKLCKPFDPTELRNPVIVHFWQMLEAVALNRSIDPSEQVPDIPVADADVKDLAKQFNSIVMPSQKLDEESRGKKRRHSEINESCTMAELRQVAKQEGIKLPARCKKADAIKILKKERENS